ncbi:hypothetical protein ACI2KG_24210 [Pseudomonas sp. NPDC089407]|uniref:hypothetical protein n=1 Tax=Pseudomonas sp. NPDC089407 TaxID=3364464 RepID=UPI00384F8285
MKGTSRYPLQGTFHAAFGSCLSGFQQGARPGDSARKPNLGSAGRAVSMLRYSAHGGFALRYNSYRFSLNATASSAAVRAFNAFLQALNSARPLTFDLQADTALLINNGRALHGRDIVQDNRRLLVRQFGYSLSAEPIVLAEDPLLVRG